LSLRFGEEIEQCRGRYDRKRKTAQTKGRLTEERQDQRCRDASALIEGNSDGQISPRVTGGDTRDTDFRKSLYKK